MRQTILPLCAAALLSACGSNPPPEPVAPAGPVAPMVDPNSPLAAPMYMQMAASSDLFEIQSSQLALQMSQNAAIRQMAQMLITDHTRMSNEMMAAARAAGLTPPPPALLPEDAALLNQLRSAPAGAAFDQAFRDAQVVAHQKALALHSNYASGGDNPALRTVASTAVPVIQGHLNHAQMMAVGPAPTMPSPTGERG